MNQEQLNEWLKDNELAIVSCRDEESQSFCFRLLTIDRQFLFGGICITDDKICREWPNIADWLFNEIVIFMERYCPQWIRDGDHRTMTIDRSLVNNELY